MTARTVDGRTAGVTLLCYHISLELCWSEEGRGRGHSHHYVVTADGWPDLFDQAKAAAANLTHNYGLTFPESNPKPHLGAVKITLDEIGPLKNGRPAFTGSLWTFEWKRDFPGTLDQYLESFLARVSRA